MVHRKTLHFVQREKHTHQEDLVLLLQWESKTINDGSKNLQKFGDSIVSLRLIDELEEHIIDATPNRSAQLEEFAVDSVECRLEEISLARVFGIEELEQVQHEVLVDVPLGKVSVEIGAFNEAQEEFVNNF